MNDLGGKLFQLIPPIQNKQKTPRLTYQCDIGKSFKNNSIPCLFIYLFIKSHIQVFYEKITKGNNSAKKWTNHEIQTICTRTLDDNHSMG
jgi:hypothetical protein